MPVVEMRVEVQEGQEVFLLTGMGLCPAPVGRDFSASFLRVWLSSVLLEFCPSHSVTCLQPAPLNYLCGVFLGGICKGVLVWCAKMCHRKGYRSWRPGEATWLHSSSSSLSPRPRLLLRDKWTLLSVHLPFSCPEPCCQVGMLWEVEGALVKFQDGEGCRWKGRKGIRDTVLTCTQKPSLILDNYQLYSGRCPSTTTVLK